jgi:putative redox protein
VKAHLTQLQGTKFEAQVEGTPAIIFDADQNDGPIAGPSPMQATLLAAMGCTASDVVSILRRQRVRFTKLEIEAEAERATEHPRVLTKIHLHFKVYGDGITESALRRAIDLSTEKYCSVGIMLRRGGVAWENTWEVLPPK